MDTNQKNKMDLKNISLADSSDLMVEEQIAHNIIELLNSHAQTLSSLQEQRLGAARNLAVTQLANQQTQAANYQGVHQNGHTLQWFGRHVGPYFEQHRLLSTILVVGAMLLALFAVQQLGSNNNLENSDAFLLASDLPPEAYADKGFNTWLGSK